MILIFVKNVKLKISIQNMHYLRLENLAKHLQNLFVSTKIKILNHHKDYQLNQQLNQQPMQLNQSIHLFKNKRKSKKISLASKAALLKKTLVINTKFCQEKLSLNNGLIVIVGKLHGLLMLFSFKQVEIKWANQNL